MSTNEQSDLLISHVVDGEATAAQWREFEAMAAIDPRLWRELAESQRDAANLRTAMRAAGDLADRVSLPEKSHADGWRVHAPSHSREQAPLRLNRIGAWTGWLVAAMVTVVATIQFQTRPSSLDSAQKGGLGTGVLPTSAADHFDEYLTAGQKEGSVLGEVPGKVLVESRPVASGEGFEIIYVRQVVERAIVPDLYRIEGTDDRGQATLARYRQPVRSTM